MKPKYLFTLVLLVLWGFSVSADQHAPLPQASLLGVLPIPGGVAGSNDVVIDQVLMGSTGENLGLKVGDQIKRVNGIKIEDFAHLVALIQSFEVGKSLQVRIKRKGQELELDGILQGRPRESSEHGEVIYDTVYIPGGRLRSIVHRPNKNQGKPAPAVFFIQGYTCGSIDDGMFPLSTTRQMIDQWVQAGLVVYKLEKYAVGESQTEKLCSEIGFDREVAGFAAGLKALKQYSFVDPAQVYLFGHSLGVLVAPLLAQNHEVAGVSGFGGVVKSWKAYLLDVYTKQASQHFNVSRAQANQDRKRVEPFLDVWLDSELNFDQIRKTAAFKKVMTHDLVPVRGNEVFHRHYTFFREVNQHDFRQIWSSLQLPTLMLHGSLDIQAIDEGWAFEIAQIVNGKSDSSLAEAHVIENAEHAFMRFASKQAYTAARNNRTYRPSHAGEQYASAIGEKVIDWIKRTQQNLKG